MQTHNIKEYHQCTSRFGLPKTLVSDNGTQSIGKGFSEFYKALSIEDVTSPVYHPRSSGLAEEFVDTFKRAIKENLGVDATETKLLFKNFSQCRESRQI